ncbi:hypothetical protein AAGS61_11505 [Lysinibacillus sp. KU-BSD001]|uniref:hypothetical protein n=1 Tax=Lysinibacillus sp. KU-BSD001 TaxID=3141328 RepID=UPI0036ECB739
MRLLLWTVLFFVVVAVIKIDLQEGTLPLAEFYEGDCVQIVEYETVRVKVTPNDTIHSLFAAVPYEYNISQSERLTLFFRYNPHLEKQSLVAGEEVLIPIKPVNRCEK